MLRSHRSFISLIILFGALTSGTFLSAVVRGAACMNGGADQFDLAFVGYALLVVAIACLWNFTRSAISSASHSAQPSRLIRGTLGLMVSAAVVFLLSGAGAPILWKVMPSALCQIGSELTSEPNCLCMRCHRCLGG